MIHAAKDLRSEKVTFLCSSFTASSVKLTIEEPKESIVLHMHNKNKTFCGVIWCWISRLVYKYVTTAHSHLWCQFQL